MGKNTVRNITISINGKEVENSLNGVGKSIGKSKASLRGLTRGTKEFKEETNKLRKLKKVYKDMNDEIRGQKSSLSKLGKQVKAIAPAMLAAFSVAAVISWGKEIVAQIQLFRELKKETKDLTDLNGTRLDDAIAKTKALADVYDQDYNELLRTANSLSKQYGVNYSEALAIIKKGFEAGGDASDDLLNQLKEYGPQFKEANLSLEEMVALIAQTEKQGIFNDKGADAIKESLLRIREGTKSTREALNGIGIDSNKLYKELESGSLSYIDAIKLVSSQLGKVKAQSPEIGTAIADIFGGPGEDAGLKFLKSLKDLNLEMDDLIDDSDEMTRLRQREVEINEKLNLAWTSLSTTGGFLNTVYLDLKESAAGFLTELNDTYNSAGRLEEITGRNYWKDGLLNPNEYNRLNDFATSLRNMTKNAELAKDPVEGLRQELTRLAGAISSESGEGDEGRDRLKLIKAQLEATGKLYSAAIDAREEEAKEEEVRTNERIKLATENEIKRANEAAARKLKKFETEEDAIDAFLRKKREDRFINSLSGLEKELAIIDQRYAREIEKFKQHTERLAEIEAAKDQEKADAKLRLQQKYLDRSAELDQENEKLKAEAELEKEIAQAETQIEKDELRLQHARDLALRELEILEAAELAKVEAVEGAEALKAKIRENFALQADKLNREFDSQERKLKTDQVKWTELTEDQKLGAVTGALASAAEAFNQGSAAWKAIKISETLIATYQAAQNAFNALATIPVVGPTLGTAAAGLATIAGLKRVQQISQTKLEKIRSPKGGRGYFQGGPTGTDPIGRDNDGNIVGYVHENEYVIPQMMTRSPRYANTIGWLEAERQKNLKGFVDGGATSPGDPAPIAPGVVDNSPLLLSTLARLTDVLETPLIAQMLVGYEDQEKLTSLTEDIEQSTNNGTLAQ